jgi:hypothetical protein
MGSHDVSDTDRSKLMVLQHVTPCLNSMQFLLALFEQLPNIYLDELAKKLEVQHSIVVSVSTVWRTFKRLSLRPTKVCLLVHLGCV